MQRSCIRAVLACLRSKEADMGGVKDFGGLWAITDLSFYSEGVGESLEGLEQRSDVL